MIDTARILLCHQLELQLHDYWHEVDFNWGRVAPEFYTKDAVFEGSSGSFYHGRARIAEFYRYREARGVRTAVHAVTNFRAALTGPDTAQASWYLHLYAADGSPPHASAPPILLAAMTDQHQRQPDGTWLCSNRKFGTLFKGGAPVTALPDSTHHSKET